jgi:uncharacterized protein YcnI
MLRRSSVLFALTLVLLALATAPAAAHTTLEPEEAVAGSTETLTFHVAHEGAATIGLDVRLPDGATVVQVPAKDGWTSSSDPEASTVTWEGGPVEADEEFEVVVELPDTTGVVVFPAIQRTTDGEVAWISPDEGEEHDGNPAPRLTLVADPSAGSTTTTGSTTTSRALPGTTLEAADEGDGGAAAPWLIGSGIAAIVAIAVGGYLLKRRMG